MEGLIWLAILVLLVIIEIVTMGLTTIWFAGGALVAFIASLFDAGIGVQVVLFLVASFALLLVTRPLAVKHFNKEREKTNADSLIGTAGIVIEKINNLLGEGAIRVNGLEWSARSADDSIIEVGSQVLIENISGVKLIVKEKNREE